MTCRGKSPTCPSAPTWTGRFPITVRALVEMGRYPALGLWKKCSGHDREIVEKVPARARSRSTWRNARFPSFPAASSSGPSWRAPWRRKRTSSCWTNRSRAWTPRLPVPGTPAGFPGRGGPPSHRLPPRFEHGGGNLRYGSADEPRPGRFRSGAGGAFPERIRETYGMNA